MPTRVIPTNDNDFLDWLANFSLKLPTYASLFGITTAQLTQLTADVAFFNWIVGCLGPVDASKAQFTSYKNLIRDGATSATGAVPSSAAPVLPTLPAPPTLVAFGVVPRCALLVAHVKESPNCTDAIATDLRILTTPPTVLTHPSGSATALPGSQVELKWIKGTHQAVIVESQVGNETAWTVLGPKMTKPWIDTRAPQVAGQPEVRRYRLRFQDADVPVGDYSDVMTVTTRP